MFKLLGQQLRKPSGFFGRLISKMLEIRNKGTYQKVIIELNIQDGDRIFEIGYGPGSGVKMIAEKCNSIVDGIDFSELMNRKAIRKNQAFIRKGTVNLTFGDFLKTDVGTQKYNKVFCVNVIYFWTDLSIAFNKIYSLLETEGQYLIYMDVDEDLKRLKFTDNFCKYSLETVTNELINARFTRVDYKLNNGYYIIAHK